jgi:hypothetical protein
MKTPKDVYTLSLEHTDGTVTQHGFHLGTDIALAKQVAGEIYTARPEVRTVAIMDGHKIADCLDSRGWQHDWRNKNEV